MEQPVEHGRSRTEISKTWRRKSHATPQELELATATDQGGSVGPDARTELASPELPAEGTPEPELID